MAIGNVTSETTIIIDTNIFSEYQRKKNFAVDAINLYLKHHKELPSIASITVFEVLQGIENELAKHIKHKKPADHIKISYNNTEKLLDQFSVVGFNKEAAKIAAYIFANIGGSKANRLRNDIYIAATALASSHGIATRNLQDFQEISEYLPDEYNLLRLAHWK